MRFDVHPDLRLFAESVRTAIGDWEPTREPDLGEWLDDRDDDLSARLVEAGWSELWADPALLAAAVAGGIELGRALAPACAIDEATLGAPLAVGERVRHGAGAQRVAVAHVEGGLALGVPGGDARPEKTLDSSGTVHVPVEDEHALPPDEAADRWRAWSAATLAYLAGLAGAALDATVEHAQRREQFGAPLASLPAVQAHLADASLAVDGLMLVAWAAASPGGPPLPAPELLWAGAACRDVTATAHQIHGAVGFALEAGLHRSYRRAKAMQAWAQGVCAIAA